MFSTPLKGSEDPEFAACESSRNSIAAAALMW